MNKAKWLELPGQVSITARKMQYTDAKHSSCSPGLRDRALRDKARNDSKDQKPCYVVKKRRQRARHKGLETAAYKRKL